MSLSHYPGEECKLGRKKLGEREEREDELVLPAPAAWSLLAWGQAGCADWMPEHRLLPSIAPGRASPRGGSGAGRGAGLSLEAAGTPQPSQTLRTQSPLAGASSERGRPQDPSAFTNQVRVLGRERGGAGVTGVTGSTAAAAFQLLLK